MYGKILIQCDLIVRTGMHIGASGAFPRSVRSTVLLSAIRSREIQSFPAAASRESSARCWQEVFPVTRTYAGFQERRSTDPAPVRKC